jgi:hypothetical protein
MCARGSALFEMFGTFLVLHPDYNSRNEKGKDGYKEDVFNHV